MRRTMARPTLKKPDTKKNAASSSVRDSAPSAGRAIKDHLQPCLKCQ